jgi:hypothetical protein
VEWVQLAYDWGQIVDFYEHIYELKVSIKVVNFLSRRETIIFHETSLILEFVTYGLIFIRRIGRPQEKCGSDDQQSNQEKCSGDAPGCKNEDMRPRRTSTSGSWSGLRIKINTFPEHIPPTPADDQSAGVLVSTAA